MSGIPRYRMTNNLGELDTDNGSWIKYEDHVAAMQAVLLQPKFKVGDRVYWDADLGTVTKPDDESSPCQEPYYVNVNWDDGNFGTVRSSDLSLYVPPKPAELIPTLKEHEWVQGTYKTGTAFGPFSVYYDEIGAKMAGDNYLIHWNTGAILDTLATLERCDAPEVK